MDQSERASPYRFDVAARHCERIAAGTGGDDTQSPGHCRCREYVVSSHHNDAHSLRVSRLVTSTRGCRHARFLQRLIVTFVPVSHLVIVLTQLHCMAVCQPVRPGMTFTCACVINMANKHKIVP